MASKRRNESVSLKPTDDKNSSRARHDSTTSAAGRKKGKATVVKSRYLQTADRLSLSKSNSLTNETVSLPVRPASPKAATVRHRMATPPRCFKTPQVPPTSEMSGLQEPSHLGRSVLQSTFSDGHYIRPEFDLSLIQEMTMVQKLSDSEKNSDVDKMVTDQETLLLTYLTVKMQRNTARLKEEAQASMLRVLEQEEHLRKENCKKEQQHLLLEQQKRSRERLELQIAVLAQVAEAAKQLTADYRSLGSALDTTTHQLPVKNFYLSRDTGHFLGGAQQCLREAEKLLEQLPCSQQLQDQRSAAEPLRSIKNTSSLLGHQLTGGLSDLQQLSSLVSCEVVLAHQVEEEGHLGGPRVQELYRSPM